MVNGGELGGGGGLTRAEVFKIVRVFLFFFFLNGSIS